MHVLSVRNVNEGYFVGIRYVLANGQLKSSRGGSVMSVPHPVATVYSHPAERVLFSAKRDANPFFHLFESLWMLSGSRDARWLDLFVKDFSSRFAEEDGLQHGAYGHRWRWHFDVEGGGELGRLPDQLDTVVRLLRTNKYDRQVVLTMWDPVADLATLKKDKPCNTHIYLRVRQIYQGQLMAGQNPIGADAAVLDITVCCRSNDAVWGCYGANAVHFSVLQEYLAARIGVGLGTYTQFSNDLHVYTSILPKLGSFGGGFDQPYFGDVKPEPMVTVPEKFDEDLHRFMEWSGEYLASEMNPYDYHNQWFTTTAQTLFVAAARWRAGERKEALAMVQDLSFGVAPDWRLAAEQWMLRRMEGTNV